MVKVERISIGGIENLVEDKDKLQNLGKGSLKDNGFGGLKLNSYGLKITKSDCFGNYKGLDETDCFLIDAEKFLKENKIYVANSQIRNRNLVNNFSKFLGQKLTGDFYQEK